MTDAILDGESVLDFVTRHYDDLKNQAQDDNMPDPSNANITAVIAQIDNLYKTITTISHEKIVEQLKALRTQYNDLGLTGPYTRYIEANNSLNMIVGGLEEVEEEGAGEEFAPGAGSPASALVPASTALVPASIALVSKASTASGTASNTLVPASESALVPASRASAPASIASTASVPESKASESKALALVPKK